MMRLKVLILGPSNSGKTTFLKAVTTTESLTVYEPTSGSVFHNYNSKMLWPKADLFVHFVDCSEVVSMSAEYLQALICRANIAVVFFDSSSKESIAKSQIMIGHLKNQADGNGLRVPM